MLLVHNGSAIRAGVLDAAIHTGATPTVIPAPAIRRYGDGRAGKLVVVKVVIEKVEHGFGLGYDFRYARHCYLIRSHLRLHRYTMIDSIAYYEGLLGGYICLANHPLLHSSFHYGRRKPHHMKSMPDYRDLQLSMHFLREQHSKNG